MSEAILLVENNGNDALFAQRVFLKLNTSQPIQWVQHSAQAISYLNGEGRFVDRIVFPFPKLALVDLHWPNTSGLQLIAWIRGQRRFESLLIVALASPNAARQIAEAYRLGADNVLVKTSQPDEFIDMVNGLHRFWLRHHVILEPIFGHMVTT